MEFQLEGRMQSPPRLTTVRLGLSWRLGANQRGLSVSSWVRSRVLARDPEAD